MRARNGGAGPAGWRGDRVTLVLFWIAIAILTATVAAIIELGKDLGFLGWGLTALAIAIIWVAGVLAIGRSDETPRAEGAPE